MGGRWDPAPSRVDARLAMGIVWTLRARGLGPSLGAGGAAPDAAVVVVRDGDAALRPARPWTDSVHALLAHLRARGIDWVPEPRGVDTRGRAAVSWVDGVVPAYPMAG